MPVYIGPTCIYLPVIELVKLPGDVSSGISCILQCNDDSSEVSVVQLEKTCTGTKLKYYLWHL